DPGRRMQDRWAAWMRPTSLHGRIHGGSSIRLPGSLLLAASGRQRCCFNASTLQRSSTPSANKKPRNMSGAFRTHDVSVRSERHVERHFALHAYLVGRGTALEEVGQLLHVLQLHEAQRIAHIVLLLHAQAMEMIVRAMLQILAH